MSKMLMVHWVHIIEGELIIQNEFGGNNKKIDIKQIRYVKNADCHRNKSENLEMYKWIKIFIAII